MKLIGQCDLLDPHQVNPEEVRLHARGVNGGKETNSNAAQTTTSSSLYSGILPGALHFYVPQNGGTLIFYFLAGDNHQMALNIKISDKTHLISSVTRIKHGSN